MNVPQGLHDKPRVSWVNSIAYDYYDSGITDSTPIPEISLLNPKVFILHIVVSPLNAAGLFLDDRALAKF